MIIHPCLSVLFVADKRDPRLQPLLTYLQKIQPLRLALTPTLPSDLSDYAVVVVDALAIDAAEQARLARYVEGGGACLGLIGPAEQPVPSLFGVQSNGLGPEMELRVLFAEPDHPLAARLPPAFYMTGRYRALEIMADHAETILHVDWRYQHSPVLVIRPVGAGQAACVTLQAFDNDDYRQIFYRTLRRLAGRSDANQTLGVGLVGYAPSVGRLHGLGAQAVEGLALRAVCDLNPQRLAEAGRTFPELRTYQSAAALGADPDIDVVIIATPPNTHARLALQMLDMGRHVVCEKPLALTRAETEAMLMRAEEVERHLGCHQNRRWDVDYLAIEQALAAGLIGDLFYMETFVGGYAHPCGYWHSHTPISGGTTYDWGAHYLDWVLRLMPETPTAVIGTRQKRVWHDVTNADQERVQIRFAGGQEAELIHSDIAAIPKPKWYLLGTEGAIVGHWQNVTVHELDPVFYFQENHIPPTEMPPKLTLQRRAVGGRLVEQTLPLPRRRTFPFHHNLADHLLTGAPLAAPAWESAAVVTVLEAAVRSIETNGSVEPVSGWSAFRER